MKVFYIFLIGFILASSAGAQEGIIERYEEKVEENVMLKAHLKNLKDDSTHLMNQLLKLTDSIDIYRNIRAERDSLNDILVSLEKELTEKSDSLKSIKDNKSDLEKRYNDLKEKSGNIEVITSENQELKDSLSLYKAAIDSLRFKADSLPDFKQENLELKIGIEEKGKQVILLEKERDEKGKEISQLQEEIRKMIILKKEKINLIEEEVNRIVLSSNFDPHSSELNEIEKQINEFIEYFPKEQKLSDSRTKINTFKENIRSINQAVDVLNVKFNSTEVNSAIKNLNGLENPSQTMLKEKNSLLQKLNNYCKMTRNTYQLIVDIDIYGSKRYKEEDLDAFEKEVAAFPYLIRALNQKKENGFKSGPVDLLPQSVKCN